MSATQLLRRIPALLVVVAVIAGVGLVSLIGAGAASASVTAKHTARQHTARQRAIAVSESQQRVWGAANDSLPGDPSAMQSLTATAGQHAGIVMWYVAWSLNSAFPTSDVSRVRSWGATPEITWEPWDPSAGVNQPQYSLANITAGNFDAYLRSWAVAAKAWGHPVRIRFAHEMNGSWYPWGQGVNGNAPGSYVAAWRHVVGLFNSVGARNVTWVWSPNVPYPGSTPLAGVFPGDRWVGEVALDGYNWGTMQGGSWTSFAGVFGPGIATLSKLSTRPIGIGEVGCPQIGGNKSAWIHGMWNTLQTWPRVRTLVWFDYNKETDWRIDSSHSSATSFSSGLSTFLYGPA